MDESISSTESTKAAQPEARIGSYRVLESLGIGGMSSVFRAVHAETNQEVALKVLTRALAKNATLLQRFLREARSAATLEHPNIVAIYDRGIDSGRHYLVLEYVAGGDFHDYVQHNGPLSGGEATNVIKSVAAALKYAANRGLIHRDVKPSNILRTPGGLIKIIDLGLALQNEFEDERVTREGTTVGTVDYMAPEQARDSRATSIQSDMYSLGCTFYYLLAGVPPFPGGDITDKLTRHAKTPPPDVRDLRPDLPAEIGAILLRLMAKRPEDRFGSYDLLTAALESVPLDASREAPGILLEPVSDSPRQDYGGYTFDATHVHKTAEPASNGSSDKGLPLVSLAELVGEDRQGAHRERAVTRQFTQERPVFDRHAQESAGAAGSDSEEAAAPQAEWSAPKTFSLSSWILPGVFLCGALAVLGVGLMQFLGSKPAGDADASADDSTGGSLVSDRDPGGSSRADAATASPGTRPPRDARSAAPRPVLKDARPAVTWVEPKDADDEKVEAIQPAVSPADEARFLPAWARGPIPDRIDGPFVTVRRVADPGDSTVVSSLHRALDRHSGGTVELADEGPLSVEDFRIAGETRLIRARPGFRSILRIDRSSQAAVREQPAVVVLKGKNLTLDGIDLIVDARELSRSQTALFQCTGADLTLRNCSITILNQPAAATLALVKAAGTSARPTHVRVERCLIRGTVAEGFRLTGGGCEVVVRDSVILAAGGPLVRVDGADATSDNRTFLVQSMVAGPGPIIEWTKKPVGRPAKALVVRAFGSAFGRLHGAGIASVIASNDSTQAAGKQVDWLGDQNLFAGWVGLFACGDDQTVTVADLAGARSTWNGTDKLSREILASWGHRGDLAEAMPADFASFVPSHRTILRKAARPRLGLYEKALSAYSDPAVPEPDASEWSFTQVQEAPSLRSLKPGQLPPEMTDMTRQGYRVPVRPGGPHEMTFRTDLVPWKGDLGAFLRDRLSPTMTFVRLRVQGSGRHSFTPVKLPRRLRLEIKVEADALGEPPSWSPKSGATGTALIELEGGALVLNNLNLRHEGAAGLEHLIHVKGGHLVLSQCQLLAPASADSSGNLIAFRSDTTAPQPGNADWPLFSFRIDRPVCRLVDCVLITGGRALQAELGSGLVALSQCAIAAGGTAIELIPAKVARHRFVDCDLVLERCTLTSERTIVRMGGWPGMAPGPDRPWLITSRNCAFMASNGRTTRETVLLRCDADALASGTILWQGSEDAAEVDAFVSVGDAPPTSNRSRDVQQHWVQFWGRSHMAHVTGPRGPGSPPSVRFRDRQRAGQAVEPSDLILDTSYHPDRPELNVGADLSRQRVSRGTVNIRPQTGPPL